MCETLPTEIHQSRPEIARDEVTILALPLDFLKKCSHLQSIQDRIAIWIEMSKDRIETAINSLQDWVEAWLGSRGF